MLIVDDQFKLSIDKIRASLESFRARGESVDNCLFIKAVANLRDALLKRKLSSRKNTQGFKPCDTKLPLFYRHVIPSSCGPSIAADQFIHDLDQGVQFVFPFPTSFPRAWQWLFRGVGSHYEAKRRLRLAWPLRGVSAPTPVGLGKIAFHAAHPAIVSVKTLLNLCLLLQDKFHSSFDVHQVPSYEPSSLIPDAVLREENPNTVQAEP